MRKLCLFLALMTAFCCLFPAQAEDWSPFIVVEDEDDLTPDAKDQAAALMRLMTPEE